MSAMEQAPIERNLPLTGVEWDALIQLIADHGVNGGVKGPFEDGKLPDSLYNKIMERTSYEYNEYDWISFDDLLTDEQILEARPVQRTPEEIKANIEGTVKNMLAPFLPNATAEFTIGEQFMEWLKTAPADKERGQ
jgi:hypothetical protein